MAARRLVIVMLVLLGASTLAAALVPVPPPDEQREEPLPQPPKEPVGNGKLVRETIRVRAGEPASTVEIALGDQLQLTVRSPRPDEVEIPALGELQDVGPQTPAFFDLLPFEPGRYLVRLVAAKHTIGEIVVEPRAAPREKAVDERPKG